MSRSKAIPLSLALQLYRRLLTTRLVEEKIVELYPTDKIQSPVHLSIGQESVAVGVCAALKPEDRIYGTYRSHALYIGIGADLKKMFAELYAKETGCAKGKGGSMHLVAPEVGLMGCSAIVGSTIPVATGHALASKMQGRKYVVVSFFGDGGVDEGVFFESINFALLKNLPILYLIENNQYAIHSKVRDRHKNTNLSKFGEGLGMKGERQDGCDVFSVYAKTEKAIEEIRLGGGPRLLEFTVYRWKEHVGITEDFHQAYRLPGEKKAALKQDPIAKAGKILQSKFHLKESELEKCYREIQKEIEEAVEFAEKSPFPKPSSLFEHVFK